MRSKPLIGINTDYRSARKDSPAYSFIAAGYHDAVVAAGGIPVVIPCIEADADIERVLSSLDGFVLIGGADLDPRRDGFMLHPSMKLLEARREDFDRKIARMIARRKMPVFGIGAGMQLLNVAMGGNLFYHIPEDLPQAIPHRDHLDQGHRHGLEVTPGSLLDRVFGDGEIRVNSTHHMAIDMIAPGFKATARCPDGVIEAIESDIEGWFAIGTQFHPESDSATAIDIRVFEEFIDGVVACREGTQLVAA
jgi:putative glutamine amidotransferase